MIATVTLNPSLDEWIDLPRLQPGRLNRASGFARYPGGKGINVSRVIRELGGRTVAFALTGGDDGAMFQSLLRRLAIPCQFLDVPGVTRNNYKIRTLQPRALTEVNTAGPRISGDVLQRLQRKLFALHRARCVVLSGSLPPGAPAAIYQRWIHALRVRHVPCALDTSGASLRSGLRASPWLVKPNRQEAEEVLGQRLTRRIHQVRAVRALLQFGPDVVILSLGSDGALMGRSGTSELWWGKPPVVRIASAVGAGDSLVGGFLAAWQQSAPLLEAFRMGVASGTATAMTPGTELCHRADVRRLLPRVTLQRVE